MNQIKIVIWDLDDTFWHGTLSEGGVQLIEDNIRLVRHLVDNGIMNSIVSKNDYEEAKNQLVKAGVWDLFIFPCINWESKGLQVKQLLEDCSLRPANAMFIDDNSQNLNEVAFYNPGIATILPDSVSELWEIKGNNDVNHERLTQYKVLEKKKGDAKEYKSNEEFLFHSNIKVHLKNDCENHKERLLDLINRSNQLNYTKIRCSMTELEDLIHDNDIETGYVEVTDDYGEYGIVGFYALRDNKAIHFLFSCRTIGMGVEQYVYTTLGNPEVEVVGEVRSDLKMADTPPWINLSEESDKKLQTSNASHVKSHIRVYITGGCDLEQLAAYMRAGNARIEYKFNVGIVRHDNTSLWKGTKTYTDGIKREMIENLPFIEKISFDEGLYNNCYDVVVMSLLMDYTQGIYQNIGYPTIKLGHGDFSKPINRSNIPDYFTAKQSDYFINNYNFIGRISESDFYENLWFVRNNLANGTKLVLINAAEVPLDHEYEVDRYKIHQIYNNVVDRFVDEHEDTYLLDMREIVKTKNQVTDNIRHYNREAYFEMARRLIQMINEVTGSNMHAEEKGITWKITNKLIHIKERMAIKKK